MPFQVSPLEIIAVLILVLVIFGPKRLPEMGKSLGRGIREFRRSISREEADRETVEGSPPAAAPPPPVIDSKTHAD